MLHVRIGNNHYEMLGNLETYFQRFKSGIVGIDKEFTSPTGKKKIIYSDWTGSGRLYEPLEEKISDTFAPYMANTHTESNVTGAFMTAAYEEAKLIIKQHVNANNEDCILFCGAGMTAAVNKLQRILGLRLPEKYKSHVSERDRPIIFISHMEHHSNHISWMETIGDVRIVNPGPDGNISPSELDEMLHQFRHRHLKIGAFTACSNVTGIQTPYHQLARVMHEHEGYCFVDFAASAPYIQMDMHPSDELEALDAIFFSPHKFLGGPGASGVLIFHQKLYTNKTPDHPGGGTVTWTNPWDGAQYFNAIERREEGGTPGILQAIRAALCMKLKEQMGIANILKREKELTTLALDQLTNIPEVHVLEAKQTKRLGIISFYLKNVHYNLMVKLLNDRYGFQLRGGCSCAGIYGHYLMAISQATSKHITDKINTGDYSMKPGWVRFSIHPTMSNREIYQFTAALKQIIKHADQWKKQYLYDSKTNDFYYIGQRKMDTSAYFAFDS